MDIQHLVDRLEDLVDEGRHMPMSKYTLIDEERALELIDQMRISIPEEIEKAARILAQRDRILSQAHEESARIVQNAREKSEKLIENDVNVQAARSQAANIVEQAKQDAEAITQEADDYAIKVFEALKQRLGRAMADVQQGIDVMQATEPTPGQPTAFAPPMQGGNAADMAEMPRQQDEDENSRYRPL
ncbi:MAG: ATP synthase F0 subunit B [Chloroflexota bacterium]